MLVAKVLIVGILVLVAIFLGGMAAAWRRASVTITRRVHTVNWMVGDGRGAERPGPPGPGGLSNEDVIRFTPYWVSLRHTLALVFLFLTVIASFILFKYYVAIPISVVTYILMELSGYLFPRRDHPYYVWQVHSSLSTSLAIANRFRDQSRTDEMSSRLTGLTRAYTGLFDPEQVDDSPDKAKIFKLDSSSGNVL